jgi:pilus assembly protein Flp/PilA
MHSGVSIPSKARKNRVGVARSFFMRRLLKEFFKNDSGATAIEYALIAMGISIVIVSAVNGVGTALSAKFGIISTSLK